MKLTFNPQVFTVKTKDVIGNVFSWELLTVDGETPDETVWFMLNGDSPSHCLESQIAEAIENGEWDVCSLSESGHELSDFNICLKDFAGAGDGYKDIVSHLRVKLKQGVTMDDLKAVFGESVFVEDVNEVGLAINYIDYDEDGRTVEFTGFVEVRGEILHVDDWDGDPTSPEDE